MSKKEKKFTIEIPSDEAIARTGCLGMMVIEDLTPIAINKMENFGFVCGVMSLLMRSESKVRAALWVYPQNFETPGELCETLGVEYIPGRSLLLVTNNLKGKLNVIGADVTKTSPLMGIPR